MPEIEPIGNVEEEITNIIDKVKIKEEDATIYGYEKAKFVLGSYGEYPIDERIKELCELTKKDYPNMDNYLIWLCAIDYVLRDEMKIDIDDKQGKELYDKYKEQRNTFIYNSVEVK